MLRLVLVPLSLLICSSVAAEPLIKLHHSPSLFAAPRIDQPEPPVKMPGWLVAQASESQPAADEAGTAAGLGQKKKRRSKGKAIYGIGLTGRGIFVPFWFLDMFLDAGTGLYSGAIGAEFIRRKRNFDLVASINFNFYSPPDGNFLGNGKPSVDIDHIVFDNLNVLSFEVDFIWHHNFTDWLSLVYGAGLGFGIVLGDVLRTSVHADRLNGNYPVQGDPPICTTGDAGDMAKCNPIDPKATDRDEQEKVWNKDPADWYDKYGKKCSSKDSPQDPCQFPEEDVWPVVPIVHLLIGLNFRVTNELNIRLTTGWHDAFYVGATTQWFFF